MMYQTLPTPDSFRLLQLDSLDDGTLSIILTVHELSENLSFKALSYTWGHPVRKLYGNEPVSTIESQTILCNGESLMIQQNLFDALHRMSREPSTLYWWADAICINQEDVAERSAQFALMGRLYSIADEVFVWLGKDESGIEDVKYVTDMYFPALERLRQERGQDYVASNINNPELGAFLDLNESISKLRRYFAFTWKRTWFSRVWTLQEVLRAARFSLHCGQHDLNWNRLSAVEEFVAHTNYRYYEIECDENQYDGVKSVGNTPGFPVAVFGINNMRQWVSLGGEAMALTYLASSWEESASVFYGAVLASIQNRSATDPRDYVYSRFGILRSYFPGSNSDNFLPDYSLSAEEVYYTTAKNIIEGSPVLLNVGNLGRDRLFPRLPSWVPDYGKDQFHFVSFPGFKFDAADCYRGEHRTWLNPGQRRYHPSPRYSSHTIKDDVLQAFGFCFDVISALGDTDEGVDRREYLLDHMRFAHDLAGKSITRDDPLGTYWRAQIWNRGPQQDGPPPSDLRNSFRAHLTVLLLVDLAKTQFAYEPSEIDGPDCTEEDSIRAFYETVSRKRLDNIYSNYFDGWKSDYAKELLPDLQFMIDATKLRYESALMDEWLTPFDTLAQTQQQEARPFLVLYQDRGMYLQQYKTIKGLYGHCEPGKAQEGDEVWCLTTSNVPMILRACGNGQRQIVGECYLHGFMDGEMLDERWGFQDAVRPVEIV